MVMFGVELYDTVLARKFIRDTNKRLSSKNMINNPFIGNVKTFLEEGEALGKLNAIINMRPLWPNLAPYIAFMLTLIFILFGASTNAYYIPIIFLALSFFWSETFFILMFRAGLRKSGYKGKFKKISNKVILEKLVERL